MAQLVSVELRWAKNVVSYGFGLVLLDKAQHAINFIAENTPADMCYMLEIGDVLVKIDETPMAGLSIAEVHKRLRRAREKVTLVLCKDRSIQRKVVAMIREKSPHFKLPPKREEPKIVDLVLHPKKGERPVESFLLAPVHLLEHVVAHVYCNSLTIGKVEPGDVLNKIGDTHVRNMTCKNVMRCLEFSSYPLRLQIFRDPWIKNYVRKQFESNEPGSCVSLLSSGITASVTASAGSKRLHHQHHQTSQLVQPKIFKLPVSTPKLDSSLQAESDSAELEKCDDVCDYDDRECVSESSSRPSRIPQARVTHATSWSGDQQSPSRRSKPLKQTKLKAKRFVITGQSQFDLSRDSEESQLKIEAADVKPPPHVNYDTLTSSTSHSEESVSYGASAQEMKVNPGPVHDSLDRDVYQFGSNTMPYQLVIAELGKDTMRLPPYSDKMISNEVNCDTSTSRKDLLMITPGEDDIPGQEDQPSSGSGHAAGAPNTEALADPPANDEDSGAVGSIASSGDLTENTNMSSASLGGPAVRMCDAAGFRTSRSEDHLQQAQRDGSIGAIAAVETDEDVNSSLNTLLDTRHDCQEQPVQIKDRFVWTYNMPPVDEQPKQPKQRAPLPPYLEKGSGKPAYSMAARQAAKPDGKRAAKAAAKPDAKPDIKPNAKPDVLSLSSSVSSSPQRSASESPASPTSVSSSVMSSSGGSREQSHAGGAGGIVNTTATVTSSTTTVDSAMGAQANQQQPQRPGYDAGSHAGSHPHETGGCVSGGGSGGSGIQGTTGGDHSVSEAVSNLSSPDYQDEHDLFSSKDLMAMAISDHSDSDSTILVSETTHRFDLPHGETAERDHKIVIQVTAGEGGDAKEMRGNIAADELGLDMQQQLQLEQQQEQQPQQDQLQPHQLKRDSSPPVSDDGSDVESLHSFHYPPKAIDRPSVERLARRLFNLEGFSKNDVCRHLNKNNEFSRVLGEEYLKYYNFSDMTLDVALRHFAKEVPLLGETQERERVMMHFSKRYLETNAEVFRSIDATYMLACALLFLNADFHGAVPTRRTFSQFVKSMEYGNEGENFPQDLLRNLYSSIKDRRLDPAIDEQAAARMRSGDGCGEFDEDASDDGYACSLQGPPVGPNPFLEAPRTFAAVEYKKGYVMRKSCYETNFKKTPFGRRSWKMFFCTLRDLVLYLHKDEHGFRRSQFSDNVLNGIRIHHALATRAADYVKKQHVFRLQTADQSEFLFQTSDSKELQSWIDTINYVCASFSAPPLEGGVGSQKRFQRPLLPCSTTKLMLRDQLAHHEAQVEKLTRMLEEHKETGPPPKAGLAMQNYRDKDFYLQFELKRYKTYYQLLNSRMTMEPQDFGNLHRVSAAALNETSQDDENGDDNVVLPDDDTIPVGPILAYHRFQVQQGNPGYIRPQSARPTPANHVKVVGKFGSL